jgi:cytoskeletal protein RodZ
LRCLAKDPAERFEDGSALATALNTREPGTAPPVTVHDDGHHDVAPSRVRRTVVAALTAAVVVGLLGLGLWAVLQEPRRALPGADATEQREQDRGDQGSSTPTATPSEEEAVLSSDSSPEPAATQSPAPREEHTRDRAPAEGAEASAEDRDDGTPSPEPSQESTPEPTPSETAG